MNQRFRTVTLRSRVVAQNPQAELTALVIDNQPTHTPVAFYGPYESVEAKRILARFEFVHTRKQVSF